MRQQPFKRSERVASLVHQETAKILQKMQDPRTFLVTITRVKVLDDLSLAMIYYTTFDINSRSEVEKMFENALSFFRLQIAEKLKLRKAIKLKFVYDTNLEEVQKVLTLLDKIKNESNF